MKEKEVIEFPKVHSHGAGIDIGSRDIFVSIDGKESISFKTFTEDYKKCCKYLKEKGIESVAMEATGVYWMSLYEMLESYGLHVCLVHPQEVQQVKGRKRDDTDACWIQKLYSAGLLRESIVAEGKLKELRILVRERSDLISMGSTYVNKMQKYLELMNIKLRNVIAQIHGASGLRVIEAILSGERDVDQLLHLCHNSIRTKKKEDVKKALCGNYNERYLSLLKENLRLWKEHQISVRNIEKQIEDLLDEMNAQKDKGEKPLVKSLSCPARHHNPEIKDLHMKLVQQFNGVNLSTIAGINDSTALRLLGEIGADMSRFPSVKHFVSWLGLSPKSKQSGKMKRRVHSGKGNIAGEIFRQSAQALSTSKHNAIGAFIRRLCGKKGAHIAIKAGARKIAIAFYNALTYGMDYVEMGAAKYTQQNMQREIKTMQKLAQKYNYQLIESV
ncbi:MAG: IS110 family transposase [Bacteroidales bacterium]|jgi:transposase|nr:IS110 family transposase [Bacteroidales bacterium]